MAEQAAVAFGRYLRTLRERRGLSLPQVCDLAACSPRSLDKGTLSRFERGEQRLALSSLIPLSRIYGIVADALVERMELDFELDKAGAPETFGKSAAELCRLGQQALLRHNRKWDAYAYFRDADSVVDEGGEPLSIPVRMNLATVARSLGKNRLALHEFRELEKTGASGERMNAVILDRISNCHRCLGDLAAAERYVAAALSEADFFGEKRVLAFVLFSRASLAFDRADSEQGLEDLRQAFHTYRDANGGDYALLGSPVFEVNTLVRMTEAYLEIGQFERASRAALAAKRLSTWNALPSGRAYSDLFLGQIDEHNGHADRAVLRWRRVAEQAETLHNKRLGFSAEFFIYRHARCLGNLALAQASLRRLERAAPWVPEHLPLLAVFREMSGSSDGRRLTRPHQMDRENGTEPEV